MKKAKSNWIGWAKENADLIRLLLGVPSALYGTVELWQQAPEIVPWIAVIVGFSLIWWTLYRIKNERSAFGNGPARSANVRSLALFGLFAIPAISLLLAGGWWYVKKLPPDEYIILVADINGPDANSDPTNTILSELRAATRKYDDVRIVALEETITERSGGDGSKVARAKGKNHEARIVIWGSYQIPGDSVLATVHFEILDDPSDFSLIRRDEPVSKYPVAEPVTFQVQLSGEMEYLVLLTLGIVRYEAEAYDDAIDYLSEAINRPYVPEEKVDPEVAYMYRGNAHTHYRTVWREPGGGRENATRSVSP